MQMEFELRCPISTDLGFIRDLIRIHGSYSGLATHRVDDLVLAVNEAVTNVLDHAGATGLITARTTGEAIVVEVLDTTGRLAPAHLATAKIDPTASHGFGLWVIQHLCDAVHLERNDLGSRLSLWMNRRPAAPAEPERRSRATTPLPHL